MSDLQRETRMRRSSSWAADSGGAAWERRLDRAVREGIVTAEQAEAVARLEVEAPGGTERRAVLAEVFGYVGGAVAVMSGVVIAQELWSDLAPWARVAVLAVIALAAGVAGAILRDREGPAGRLGSFLWLVTVVATAATGGVMAAGVFEWAPASVALTAAGSAALVAALLWWLRPASLQQAALFAASIATVVAGLARIDTSLLDYAGLVVWVIGLAWAVLAWGGVMRPAALGWLLGAVAMLFGPLNAIWARETMLVLGLVTAAGLLAIGVRFHRAPLAVLATLGLFVYVPLTLADVFGTSLAPMALVFVVGIALVTAGVALARALPHDDERAGDGDRH